MKTCFDKPYEVVFLEDGADITLPKTKSVKLDISKFVKKYIPGEYALTPEQQEDFNQRAYMEILEECSKLLVVKRKFQESIVPEYKVMFTPEGQAL